MQAWGRTARSGKTGSDRFVVLNKNSTDEGVVEYNLARMIEDRDLIES